MASVYDEIEAFFAWNPPPLVIGPKHVTSQNTRAPQLFDKHLDESLILKHLVHLPSLPAALEKVADNAFIDFKDRCEFTPRFGTLKKNWATDFKSRAILTMRDESTVSEVYALVAKQCAKIASTLALTHQPSKIEGLLSFTAAVGGSEATPDGTFILNELDSSSSISIEKKAALGLVDKYFPETEIGLLEFKSLKAGKEGFMRAVEALAQESDLFPWEHCVFHDCGTGCQTKHGLKTVKGAKMGFDAKSTPWASSVVEHFKRLQQEDTAPRVTKRKCSSDRPPSKGERTHAIHMIQQLWAEAVQHDATLLVLTSVNWEIIGVRDRQTQTLYISSVAYSPQRKNPCYGKLHVGIVIAALEDVINRAWQLEEADKNHSLPRSWTRTTWEQDALMPEQRLQQILQRAHDVGVVHLYTAKSARGIMGMIPNFTARKPLKLFRNPQVVPLPDASSFPPLHLAISKRIDSFVFDVTLSFGDIAYLDQHVVVKLAYHEDHREQLYHESTIYRFLKDKNVQELVDVIGFFDSPPKTPKVDNYSALVMSTYGSPSQTGIAITEATKNKFRIALRAIHGAGIIHGQLSLDHLLVDGDKVAIIGYTRAVKETEPSKRIATDEDLEVIIGRKPKPKSRSEKEMDNERVELEDILAHWRPEGSECATDD